MRKPSASRHPSCAAFWVKAIAEAMESDGLALPPLFAEAGLDLGALGDPDARFASDKINRLWQLAVLQSGNPTLGLASAMTARPASFDVFAYAMMSAPDLHGILERIVRYIRVFNDAADVAVTDSPEGFRIALSIFS